MKPEGSELIRRYKKNYGIPAEASVTEQMILAHWDLERQLTSELLQSRPEDRWETFDRCYTRLYAELDWLNRFSERADPTPLRRRIDRWLEAIGSPPKSIYEIGSGTGELISHLAQHGFNCKATEITRERGQKHVANSQPNLSWGLSDGVHLDRFEPAETYDVVLSNQVIEHLHPEDLQTHLSSVHNILRKGGRYMFSTPHRYTGPHDVSWVFGRDQAEGMHLKEYTYRELVEAIRRAGFSDAYFGFVPAKLRRFLTVLGARRRAEADSIGRAYLDFMLPVERALGAIPTPSSRRLCTKALRKLCIFSDSIWLIAEKKG